MEDNTEKGAGFVAGALLRSWDPSVQCAVVWRTRYAMRGEHHFA